MQTTAHVRDSSWDEVAVHYDHVPEKQVTYFYVKRPRNELFEPWLVRAPSALLARRGVRRMGLYAGRRFVSEGVIGKYDGRVVESHATREAAVSADSTRHLVRQGSDQLRLIRTQGGRGWDVVDGEDGPLPSLGLVQDPRGTNFRPNVAVSEYGYMRVVSASIPAFDLGKAIDQNIGSELKHAHGEPFWSAHDHLGSEDMPFEL